MWVKVANCNEIPEGEGKAIECAAECVAVFNVGGTFFAISNTCPHAGGPLADGFIDDNEVTCPWHGWSFGLDPSEGNGDGISRYKVKVEDDAVHIEMPD
ncbi:MAG: hypothetical protein AMXMBFR84_47730 [Candidatus Hydrogenedentota bacterium]